MHVICSICACYGTCVFLYSDRLYCNIRASVRITLPVCGVKWAQVRAQETLQLPRIFALRFQDVLEDLAETWPTNTHTQIWIFITASDVRIMLLPFKIPLQWNGLFRFLYDCVKNVRSYLNIHIVFHSCDNSLGCFFSVFCFWHHSEYISGSKTRPKHNILLRRMFAF